MNEHIFTLTKTYFWNNFQTFSKRFFSGQNLLHTFILQNPIARHQSVFLYNFFLRNKRTWLAWNVRPLFNNLTGSFETFYWTRKWVRFFVSQADLMRYVHDNTFIHAWMFFQFIHLHLKYRSIQSIIFQCLILRPWWKWQMITCEWGTFKVNSM